MIIDEMGSTLATLSQEKVYCTAQQACVSQGMMMNSTEERPRTLQSYRERATRQGDQGRWSKRWWMWGLCRLSDHHTPIPPRPMRSTQQRAREARVSGPSLTQVIISGEKNRRNALISWHWAQRRHMSGELLMQKAENACCLGFSFVRQFSVGPRRFSPAGMLHDASCTNAMPHRFIDSSKMSPVDTFDGARA